MAIVVVEELSKNDVLKAREEYSEYIKITADISRKIVAIGGEYHADAEEILIKDFKCKSENIWGGGYNIKLKKFEANAVLNIKNPRPYGRGFVFRFVSRFARLLISLHLRPDGRSFRFLGIKPQINDSLEIIDPKIRDDFFELVKDKLKNIEIFL